MDLQFIPVDNYIEELEAWMGLERDVFVLTENFSDFELNSTSVMMNLQIILPMILILIALPLLFLVLFGVCFRIPKCRSRLMRVADCIFLNTYIRFMLESYLEISIVCFLHLRRPKIDSGSARFNSLLALTLSSVLIMLLVGSIGLLHCRGPLKKEPPSRRYSELVSGLKTHRRMSLLSPTFFMARRLLYAYILVNWVDLSVALVLGALILFSGLQVAYLAHNRPN